MGHRQKGKSKKRLRAWHRGRNQDAKWRKAMKRIDGALKHYQDIRP